MRIESVEKEMAISPARADARATLTRSRTQSTGAKEETAILTNREGCEQNLADFGVYLPSIRPTCAPSCASSWSTTTPSAIT